MRRQFCIRRSRFTISTAIILIGGLLGSIPIASAKEDPRLRPDVYVVGTETLRADEMRVIALGTGVPAITQRQAATSFLVQLGNGDNFIFDMGTGAISNLVQLQLSWNSVDKVFLSHLHFDHIGDLDALLIVGVTHGRNNPLRIWGPDGKTPELGTAYAVARLQEAYNWELTSKRGVVPTKGYQPIVREFDHRRTQVVYEENGVKITSWPAVHVMDGPVSYALEWNGLKFVFSGDTVPNKWFLENAHDADLLLHEVYIPLQKLVGPYGQSPESAWTVGTRVHTQPASAGKLFSMLKPRMAAAFHFINGISSGEEVREEIRSTYDGPLTLARDLMVWNISKDFITVRETVGRELVWPSPDKLVGAEIEREKRTQMSKWLEEGRLEMKDIDRRLFDQLDKSAQQQIIERIPGVKTQLGRE